MVGPLVELVSIFESLKEVYLGLKNGAHNYHLVLQSRDSRLLHLFFLDFKTLSDSYTFNYVFITLSNQTTFKQ